MDSKIEKEVFCLQYELKTMSEIFFKDEAERWVYGFMHKTTEVEHLDRYNFLLDKVENKRVLDIACGSGYGSYLLAAKGDANQVVGVDLDSDAIKYGQYKYPHEKIKRFVADATTFNNSELFDVIVSFETIEHIPDYNLLLENFHKLLKKDGVLYISTPIAKETTHKPKNPYHVIEWSFYDFHKQINKWFRIEDIYLQNVVIKNMEQYKIPSFPLRIYNLFLRIFFPKSYKEPYFPTAFIKGKIFEKFINQHEMSECLGGYQMLVVKKNE